MISQSFYEYVTAQTAVTALLANQAQSMFPSILPEQHDVYPALTYELEGEDDISLLGGGASGLHFASMEINAWAETAPDAHAVAAALKSVLVGYRGDFGSDFADHIAKTGEFAGFENPTRLHYVRLTFQISYR